MRMAVIALFAASVPAACAPKASAPAAAAPAAPAIAEPARTAGLERAFEVARRFPERAFIKDRAKYEGVVVDACLALGDVPAATAFADRSCFTWRRCESLALVADRLAERGVPNAVVNAPADIHLDPQVVANELLVVVDHPVGGHLRVPRPVGELDDEPFEVQRLAPGLGEHTDEVLGSIGVDAGARAELRAHGVIA